MISTSSAARAAATIGVLALALAGCGGDDDAEPGASSQPSSAASATAAAGSANRPADEPEDTLPARWWIWAGKAPAGKNPIADTSGEFCTTGQPDDVFFLAGTFGETGVERTCTVPADTPVYFPLINVICPVQGDQSDSAAFKDCTLDGTAKATLDGKTVTATEQTSGARFRFRPTRGNELSDYAGDAVAWGRWAGPLTLEPGEHTLKISATSNDFSVGVTYDLTVG